MRERAAGKTQTPRAGGTQPGAISLTLKALRKLAQGCRASGFSGLRLQIRVNYPI